MVVIMLLGFEDMDLETAVTVGKIARMNAFLFLDAEIDIEHFLWVQGVDVDKLKVKHGIESITELLE